MNRGTTLPVDLRLFSRLNMVTGLGVDGLVVRTVAVPYAGVMWITNLIAKAA